ncbi:MAG: hypothetical protein ACXW30_05810 [Micavibrio sp.]
MPLTRQDLRLENAVIWTPSGTGQVRAHHESYDEQAIRDHFHRAGCPAISIGHVPNPTVYSAGDLMDGYIDVYRLPIKTAGSNEYRFPVELARYADTVKLIAEDQHARSPAALFKHAVLYVTRSFVPRNSFQRTPSWHCDDGESIGARLQCDKPVSLNVPVHVYVASDIIPTQVQNQPVSNAYSLFGHPHGSQAEQKQASRVLNPYEIALMNNYVWHRGTRADEGTMRNFLSVMYLPTDAVEQGIAKGLFRPQTRDFEL